MTEPNEPGPRETFSDFVKRNSAVVAVAAAAVFLVLGILIGSLGKADVSKSLLDGLLGWPFLLFALVLLGAFIAGERFLKMMEGRKWSIGKDGISFEEELSRVDEETTDNAAEMKALADRIATLEGEDAPEEAPAIDIAKLLGTYRVVQTDKGPDLRKSGAGPKLESLVRPAGAAEDEIADRHSALADRLSRALRHRKFTWRSIERLALEAGATEDEVRGVLADDRDRFRLGKGATGRELGRLRE